MSTKDRAKTLGRDAIEKELHAVREEYARQFGYDVHAMFEDLRKKQEQGLRQIVSFPPKRLSEAKDTA